MSDIPEFDTAKYLGASRIIEAAHDIHDQRRPSYDELASAARTVRSEVKRQHAERLGAERLHREALAQRDVNLESALDLQKKLDKEKEAHDATRGELEKALRSLRLSKSMHEKTGRDLELSRGHETELIVELRELRKARDSEAKSDPTGAEAELRKARDTAQERLHQIEAENRHLRYQRDQAVRERAAVSDQHDEAIRLLIKERATVEQLCEIVDAHEMPRTLDPLEPKSVPMDREVQSMADVARTLDPLEQAARYRVVRWLVDRFGG